MFDPMYILVSMIVSAIGFGGFLYGKRAGKPKHLVVGITMMAIGYFVYNPLLLGVLGAGLTALLFVDVNRVLMSLQAPRGQIEDIT